MKVAKVLLILVVLFLFVSCTRYYTRTFRLSTVDPGRANTQPPPEVFTGPFGTVGSWEMGIRMISTFESNEKEVLKRDTFVVAVTAESADRRSLRPHIDSVSIRFANSAETMALPLESVSTDSISFEPKVRHTFRFGNIRIPHEVDTVDVQFEVQSPRSAVPEGKQFNLTMVRFEGRFIKFGNRPKGW